VIVRPTSDTAAAATHETEIKIGLAGAEDYARLRQALGAPARETKQQNLFLDTPDRRLGQARWALRLRLEREADVADTADAAATRRALLAVKGPARRLSGAVHRTDIEVPVEPDLWDVAQRAGGLHPAELQDAAEPLSFLRQQVTLDPHAPLHVIMAFDNLRSGYPVSLGGARRELLLDRTRFSTGEVDHELEVEIALDAPPDAPESQLTLRQARADLEELLAHHGLSSGPSLGGKLSRSLRYADRHQGH